MKALTIALLVSMSVPPAKGPVKVFILAGQSNMQGQGALKTIDWLGKHPTQGSLLDRLKNKDGSWTVRDDVWVYYPRDAKTVKKGPLTAGYGAGDDRIGPEWTFGHVVGDRFENQVLLIKTCWGGRSLAVDFRPPSSGGTTGPSYTQMIEIVRDCLKNLSQLFPDYDGKGVELAGFVWFQGWNDLINKDRVAEYETNLVNLIKDVRRDLGAPKLPFVIGELGVGGEESAAKNPSMAAIRKAQAAPSERAEFKGSVACVATSQFWDREAEEFLKKNWINRKWVSDEAKAHFETMGNQPEYHYLGSARIFALIGHGLGEAMVKLCPERDCRTLDGWTIYVRPELLESDPGRSALRVLDGKLQEIARVVPPRACAELRKVPIWLCRGEGTGAGAEYHPSEAWLRRHGYDPRKARAVEIGDAAQFLRFSVPEPSVLIHELAHAYHDRVLGFDHPGIKAAYQHAIEGLKYESVLHVSGSRKRHYALTNEREYFAEACEAWFGTNDFYPFVRAELRQMDPEICAVLEEVWSR